MDKFLIKNHGKYVCDPDKMLRVINLILIFTRYRSRKSVAFQEVIDKSYGYWSNGMIRKEVEIEK